VISDQTNQDYSEWFVGYSKSPYYTKKEPDKRELYATKCMKYLTFLDYTTLGATDKKIDAKLKRNASIELQIRTRHETYERVDISYAAISKRDAGSVELLLN